MKEIKIGDIVVSMINQSTGQGSCPIPMGYVSKAIVGEAFESRDPVVWFEETTSGEGSYPAENFRLATKKEAEDYIARGPYTIALDRFDFLPGDKVSTKYFGNGTVVGISTINTNPSYLVKLNTPLEVKGHNGNNASLFIGSAKGLNNDGWYYPPEDLQKLSVSSTSTDTVFVHPDAWGISSNILKSSIVTLPKDYVGFNTSNHNLDAPFYSAYASYVNKELHSLQAQREAGLQEMHSQSMIKEILSMSSDKKDVKHQDAIILKSKSNKRKLITI